MSDLKPCPFCGSTNLKTHVYKGEEPDAFVQCHDCSSTGPSGEGETGAIEAWNRHAQPAQAGHDCYCGRKWKHTSYGWASTEPEHLWAAAGQVLSEEEMLRAILPLCHNDTVARLLVENSGDEYRAIEAAVLAKRVPMTPKDYAAAIDAAVDEDSVDGDVDMWAFIAGIKAAERHHGIVGKEGEV